MVVTEFEDILQNWGSVEDSEYNKNYRPITLDAIRKNHTLSRPVPPVQHGNLISPKDEAHNNQDRVPTVCDAATFICCVLPEQSARHECYLQRGCTLANSDFCSNKTILEVIKRFQNFYNKE